VNAYEEGKYLEGCMDAIDLVDEDRTQGFRDHLTTQCTECDTEVATMSPRSATLHRIYRGYVLVGCEGYLTIDPRTMGLDMPNWQDWREG